MTKSEAAQHLRTLMAATQKLRSIMAENKEITDEKGLDTLHMTEAEAGETWKWVWGPKCILPTLIKVLDHYDDTGELDGHTFMNLMYVALYLEPLLGAVAGITAVTNGIDFPETVDVRWAAGWEK